MVFQFQVGTVLYACAMDSDGALTRAPRNWYS